MKVEELLPALVFEGGGAIAVANNNYSFRISNYNNNNNNNNHFTLGNYPFPQAFWIFPCVV